ncbi:MAG: formate dehydrogenase accessory sulfurtransferase FdhD [Planctomycetes bacterium]|nr:formate dehydrogenase accessory sulfurtransferase FdhD [Planctomycetota bacterium]
MPVKRTVPVRRVGPGLPRHRPGGPGGPEHTVIEEAIVEVVLNGRVLVRAGCLPEALDDFALGFLASEGLIAGPGAVTAISVSPDQGRVEVRAEVDPDLLVAFRERLAISTGCGRGASSAAEDLPTVASDARFEAHDLLDRMKDMDAAGDLFRETGGVHAAAATDGRTLLAFAEDLGRHNAVDKVIGRCLRRGRACHGVALAGRALADLAILSTGRLSADILAKAARVGVPVLVSRGAVTARAIQLAAQAGIAAVGFARARRMNVYTAPWRLGLGATDEGGPPP